MGRKAEYPLRSLLVTDRAVVQPRPQPKRALTDFGLQPYIHGLRLIYRPRKDERLSCTIWLTHGGQFTIKVNSAQFAVVFSALPTIIRTVRSAYVL